MFLLVISEDCESLFTEDADCSGCYFLLFMDCLCIDICVLLVFTPMFGSRGNTTVAVNTIQDLKEGLLVQVLI